MQPNQKPRKKQECHVGGASEETVENKVNYQIISFFFYSFDCILLISFCVFSCLPWCFYFYDSFIKARLRFRSCGEHMSWQCAPSGI